MHVASTAVSGVMVCGNQWTVTAAAAAAVHVRGLFEKATVYGFILVRVTKQLMIG